MIITRTKSGDHGVDREIKIQERDKEIRDLELEREIIIRERERREEVDSFPDTKEEVRVHKRYTDTRRKRDKLWTEISKDLVVREALERAGYEFDETENFYYVFEYLRYVSLSSPLHRPYSNRHDPERRRKTRRPERRYTPIPSRTNPRHASRARETSTAAGDSWSTSYSSTTAVDVGKSPFPGAVSLGRARAVS